MALVSSDHDFDLHRAGTLCFVFVLRHFYVVALDGFKEVIRVLNLAMLLTRLFKRVGHQLRLRDFLKFLLFAIN